MENKEEEIEAVKGQTPSVHSSPRDAEVVIGTPEEALWQNLKTQAEQRVLQSIAGIEIDKVVISLAEEKLKNLQTLKLPLD